MDVSKGVLFYDKGKHGGNKCTTFIERVRFELHNVIKLFPKYIIKGCHDDSFDGFEMMGEALDDFFSPSAISMIAWKQKSKRMWTLSIIMKLLKSGLLFLRTSLLQLPCLMAIFYVGV